MAAYLLNEDHAETLDSDCRSFYLGFGSHVGADEDKEAGVLDWTTRDELGIRPL
jgi:hypothetical protein